MRGMWWFGGGVGRLCGGGLVVCGGGGDWICWCCFIICFCDFG